jgi:hypothetical protein
VPTDEEAVPPDEVPPDEVPPDEAPPEEPKAPRRRKKKKRQTEAKPATPVAPKPRRRGLYWAVGLFLAALFELWLFGRRGHIEVCVGRQGEHDFALLGTPRTDENTRRYPSCEKRLNLGVTSHYDEAVEDAMLYACRRANILRGRDAILICAVKEDGWEHRVVTSWCPPWHDHYYKRLFWFLDRDGKKSGG